MVEGEQIRYCYIDIQSQEEEKSQNLMGISYVNIIIASLGAVTIVLLIIIIFKFSTSFK